MLCDSNRRPSNTRITARCQIIYFPLVFPAPEILKHNSQNDLPIDDLPSDVQSLKWLPLHVGSKALLLHGLVYAFVWPHVLPLTPPFSFLTGILGFPWTGTPGSGPASVPMYRLFFFAWAAFPELLYLQTFAQLTFSRESLFSAAPLQDTPNPLLLSKFYFILVFNTFEHILQCTVLLCWFLSVFFPSQNNEF